MSDKQDLVAVGRNSVFLQIKEVLISDLKPRSRNARIHPDKQIFMLARKMVCACAPIKIGMLACTRPVRP